tara:strand:- start:592 stop:975 length:384 start_codon:yes stop_codon:yes gene_type:complete
MSINVQVSIGELLDKISILIIKEKNIKDETKLSLVKNELNLLKKTIEKFESKSDLYTYIDKLVEINTKLWNIEDQIRDCERKKTFDQNFIDLARSVYITNDQRSEIKLEINKKFDSGIVEVKSYEKY